MWSAFAALNYNHRTPHRTQLATARATFFEGSQPCPISEAYPNRMSVLILVVRRFLPHPLLFLPAVQHGSELIDSLPFTVNAGPIFCDALLCEVDLILLVERFYQEKRQFAERVCRCLDFL
jgi:hypothetical protein